MFYLSIQEYPYTYNYKFLYVKFLYVNNIFSLILNYNVIS